MKNIVFSIIAFSMAAIAADTKPFTDQLESAKAEFVAKSKASRLKLIDGLKREEKSAQASGKLELVLDIRARVAELESMIDSNPFGDSEQKSESAPVSGSMSEKTYLSDLEMGRSGMEKKIISLISSIESKKTASTKLGKIEDALAYEGLLADVRNVLESIKKSTVESTDEPIGIKIGGATCYDLTEMRIVSSKVGYAELGISKSSDGVHLPRIKGIVAKKYIMACAPASVVYNIPSGAQKFETTVLRADDLNGSIKMIVKIDGKVVFESKEMSKQADAEKVMINIPDGSKSIELIADPMGAITNDYACWVEPKFWKK